jgi:hypothetical protein
MIDIAAYPRRCQPVLAVDHVEAAIGAARDDKGSTGPNPSAGRSGVSEPGLPLCRACADSSHRS